MEGKGRKNECEGAWVLLASKMPGIFAARGGAGRDYFATQMVLFPTPKDARSTPDCQMRSLLRGRRDLG